MWVRASTLPYARKSHLLQHEHSDSYASAHLIRCSLGSVTRVKGKGADRGGRSTMKRARTTSWTRNTMRAWVLATRPTRRISSQFFPSFPFVPSCFLLGFFSLSVFGPATSPTLFLSFRALCHSDSCFRCVFVMPMS